MKRFEAWWSEFIDRHRWMVIGIVVLMVFAAASGLRFLTFNNDYRYFFSKENPQLQALEKVEKVYGKDDTLLLAVSPKEGDLFNRETLAAIEELTALAWKIPFSSRVESITNFQHTQARNDDLIVQDLVRDAATLSDKDIQRIKRIALSDPLMLDFLISRSGRATNVNVTIIKPGKSLDESAIVASSVRKIKEDFERKYPHLRVYPCGSIMIDAAFEEATQDDLKNLVPLVFIVLFLIVGFSLRSITGIIAVSSIIIFSVLTALGLAGWFGIPMTTTAAPAPTIILTLCVAESMHVLTTMFEMMRQGMARRKAIVEAVKDNFEPIVYTTLTTAIGFLALNPSDTPPFRDLGNIVAMGMFAALFYALTFLPALMSIVPVRIRPRSEAHGRSFKALSDFIFRYRTPLFWGITIFTMLCSVGMYRIELNDNFGTYVDQRYEFRKAFDFIHQEKLTGLDVISYSLDSGESGGINDPEYLGTLEAFANWARTQSKVVHVHTITDVIKRLNKNLHSDDENYYRIPDNRDLIAQYMLLYTMSLPFGHDLNNQINVDRSAARVGVRMANPSSKDLNEFDVKARDWLMKNAPKRMFTYGAGIAVVFAHISERNIRSMLWSSFLELILISIFMIVATRSFKIGILSLIPNLAPVFVTYGLVGLLLHEVGLTISVIGAIAMGIIVDDTTHFFIRYLRGRRELGLSPSESILYVFKTVGSAVVKTTAALICGFLVLGFSGFKINFHMGTLTSTIMGFALAYEFFLTPTMILKLEETSSMPVLINIRAENA